LQELSPVKRQENGRTVFIIVLNKLTAPAKLWILTPKTIPQGTQLPVFSIEFKECAEGEWLPKSFNTAFSFLKSISTCWNVNNTSIFRKSS
jgi:hypothetical protein